MTNAIDRLLIAEISGCDITQVAKVLQAARFVSTRNRGSGVMDLARDGLCSAIPATKPQQDAVRLALRDITTSLATSLGGNSSAKSYLDNLTDPTSYVYGGDDDEAIAASEELTQPPAARKRVRTKR